MITDNFKRVIPLAVFYLFQTLAIIKALSNWYSWVNIVPNALCELANQDILFLPKARLMWIFFGYYFEKILFCFFFVIWSKYSNFWVRITNIRVWWHDLFWELLCWSFDMPLIFFHRLGVVHASLTYDKTK